MDITELTLDKNVDAYPSLGEKVHKAPKGADFYYHTTECLMSGEEKNYKLRFKKVKGTKDQFIFETENPIKIDKKEN